LEPVHFVAHPGDDLAPGLLGLGRSEYVQLVDQGMADLEADDGLRLLHGSADDRAAVLPAAVELDLFVALLGLDPKAPIEGHLLDRREENVPDLRIGWSEVAGVDTGPLPHMLAQSCAAHPGLARAESSNEAAELVGQSQEIGLRNIKRRHRASSRRPPSPQRGAAPLRLRRLRP